VGKAGGKIARYTLAKIGKTNHKGVECRADAEKQHCHKIGQKKEVGQKLTPPFGFCPGTSLRSKSRLDLTSLYSHYILLTASITNLIAPKLGHPKSERPAG